MDTHTTRPQQGKTVRGTPAERREVARELGRAAAREALLLVRDMERPKAKREDRPVFTPETIAEVKGRIPELAAYVAVTGAVEEARALALTLAPNLSLETLGMIAETEGEPSPETREVMLRAAGDSARRLARLVRLDTTRPDRREILRRAWTSCTGSLAKDVAALSGSPQRLSKLARVMGEVLSAAQESNVPEMITDVGALTTNPDLVNLPGAGALFLSTIASSISGGGSAVLSREAVLRLQAASEQELSTLRNAKYDAELDDPLSVHAHEGHHAERCLSHVIAAADVAEKLSGADPSQARVALERAEDLLAEAFVAKAPAEQIAAARVPILKGYLRLGDFTYAAAAIRQIPDPAERFKFTAWLVGGLTAELRAGLEPATHRVLAACLDELKRSAPSELRKPSQEYADALMHEFTLEKSPMKNAAGGAHVTRPKSRVAAPGAAELFTRLTAEIPAPPLSCRTEQMQPRVARTFASLHLQGDFVDAEDVEEARKELAAIPDPAARIAELLELVASAERGAAGNDAIAGILEEAQPLVRTVPERERGPLQLRLAREKAKRGIAPELRTITSSTPRADVSIAEAEQPLLARSRSATGAFANALKDGDLSAASDNLAALLAEPKVFANAAMDYALCEAARGSSVALGRAAVPPTAAVHDEPTSPAEAVTGEELHRAMDQLLRRLPAVQRAQYNWRQESVTYALPVGERVSELLTAAVGERLDCSELLESTDRRINQFLDGSPGAREFLAGSFSVACQLSRSASGARLELLRRELTERPSGWERRCAAFLEVIRSNERAVKATIDAALEANSTIPDTSPMPDHTAYGAYPTFREAHRMTLTERQSDLHALSLMRAEAEKLLAKATADPATGVEALFASQRAA